MAARSPSVVRALASATRAAQPGPGDAATVALAKAYADLIDRAARLAVEADALLEAARAAGDDGLVLVASKLRAELDLRAAVSDLGPKLLAALGELRMTPKARAAVLAGGGAPAGADDPLARLLAGRRARAH
jgi:hypothetical protein